MKLKRKTFLAALLVVTVLTLTSFPLAGGTSATRVHIVVVANAKASAGYEQLPCEWRRWIHDVQRCAGSLSVE